MPSVSVDTIGTLSLDTFPLESEELAVELMRRTFDSRDREIELAELEWNDTTKIGTLRFLSGEARFVKHFGFGTSSQGQQFPIYYGVGKDGKISGSRVRFYALGKAIIVKL